MSSRCDNQISDKINRFPSTDEADSDVILLIRQLMTSRVPIVGHE